MTHQVRTRLFNKYRQVRTDLLRDGPVEEDLEVSVGAERLPDVAPSSILGPQLDRLEPVDVGTVEEHEPDNGWPLVNLERVAGENSPLDDRPVGIDG